MKEIELGNDSPLLPELLNLATEENLIIRTPDGKEFLLAEIDDFDEEVALVREHEALRSLLDQRSKSAKTYTLEEVRETLGLK